MSCHKFRVIGQPYQMSLSAPIAPPPPAELTKARQHIGTQRSLIERHRRDAMRYDQLDEAQRRDLHSDLLNRWADTRMLFAAVEKRARSGPKAAGPNGERLERLLRTDRRYIWSELRRLSAAILDGSYRPAPSRLVSIPKSSGRGERQIAVSNWQDAIVAAAGVLVLQPIVEWLLPETCLAFRPNRDVTNAIALADALMHRDKRWVVLTLDIENAFDNVPHPPLLTRLRQIAQNDDYVDLIERLVGNDTGRGTPQGCPLSPLCLNVLLADAVTAKVEREHPNVPLLQYADDLLALCLSEEEAHDVRDSILRHVSDLGMALKPSPTDGLCDLRRGDAANWLGYRLQTNGEHDAGRRTTWDLPLDWERDLRGDLSEALEKGDGVAKCRALLLNQCSRMGPLDRVRFEVAKRALFRSCEDLGLAEVWKDDEVTEARDKVFARFRALRALALGPTERATADRSGAPLLPTAATAALGGGLTRRDGHSSADVQTYQPIVADLTAAPPESSGGAARFSTDVLWTDVHLRVFSTRTALYGWAARAVSTTGATVFTRSGSETSSTHMRCCLQALKKTFDCLDAADRTHARLHFGDPKVFRVAEMLIQFQRPGDLDAGTHHMWSYANAARLRLSIDLCPHAWRSASQPSVLASPVPMAVAGPAVAGQGIPPAPF
jgi:retron-type reverse transcriptase